MNNPTRDKIVDPRMEQIVDLCCKLECDFNIGSEWHQYAAKGFSMRFVWRIESSVRGRSNANGPHVTLDDCLQVCLDWLENLE